MRRTLVTADVLACQDVGQKPRHVAFLVTRGLKACIKHDISCNTVENRVAKHAHVHSPMCIQKSYGACMQLYTGYDIPVYVAIYTKHHP